MSASQLANRYRELQRYVGWCAKDAERVRGIAAYVAERMSDLIDDFYAEILRHPPAAAVITGGDEQVARLKRTLHGWIEELLTGPYDETYVHRRARVGMKHVEIGRRLVEQEHARLLSEGARQMDALALAGGKLVHSPAGERHRPGPFE